MYNLEVSKVIGYSILQWIASKTDGQTAERKCESGGKKQKT